MTLYAQDIEGASDNAARPARVTGLFDGTRTSRLMTSVSEDPGLEPVALTIAG